MLRTFEQLTSILLPDGCPSVGAMAVRLVRGWNQVKTAFANPLNFSIGNS